MKWLKEEDDIYYEELYNSKDNDKSKIQFDKLKEK